MQSNSHHSVQWFIGLSNGENAHEGVGQFAMVPGELSPWQKLMAYAVKNKLHFTSMSLRTADGRSYNLPSLGSNPKFNAFGDAPKPIDYTFFRKMAADVMPGKPASSQDMFTVIAALYEGGHEVELWVDEAAFNCWVLSK